LRNSGWWKVMNYELKVKSGELKGVKGSERSEREVKWE
jgi:hypothetical protein